MAGAIVEVLKEIRDEARKTNVRLDQTVERLDVTVDRLDQTVERLDQTVDRLGRVEKRQVEMEIRLATELPSVVGAIHELRDVMLEDRTLRSDVADHEMRIRRLEGRGG
jgi:hypothetical protein